MKQIVTAMKEKHFDLPGIFWQQTRTFSETRCVTMNFETQVIPREQIPFWKRNSGGTLSFCNYNLKRNTSIIKILSFIDLSARATLQM